MNDNFVEKLTTASEPRKPASSSFPGPKDPAARDESATATALLNRADEGKSGHSAEVVNRRDSANGSHHVVTAATETLPNAFDAGDATIFRTGYVAIIGQPNVGKSTLLNALLHFKLSIVSPKPQTTRKRILGILNRPHSQMVLFDTPGILEAHYRLQQALVRAAFQAMKEADVQIMMVEPAAPLPADLAILNRLADTGKPILVVINKIDTVPKDHLLPIIQAYQSKANVKEIVPIAALHKDGVVHLAEVIEKYLPEQEPFYDTEQVTDHPERFLAAEIVREKIFLRYGEEIPYSTSVQVEEFVERPGHKDYIRAIIYVERESQKGILIGKGGQALKQVGKLAREEMEQLIGRPVYLELFVAVKERWREREVELRSLGYL